MTDMSAYEIVTRRAAEAIRQVEMMTETLRVARVRFPDDAEIGPTIIAAGLLVAEIRGMLADDAEAEDDVAWLTSIITSTVRLHATLLVALASAK